MNSTAWQMEYIDRRHKQQQFGWQYAVGQRTISNFIGHLSSYLLAVVQVSW